jgi:hypothetical protein
MPVHRILLESWFSERIQNHEYWNDMININGLLIAGDVLVCSIKIEREFHDFHSGDIVDQLEIVSLIIQIFCIVMFSLVECVDLIDIHKQVV